MGGTYKCAACGEKGLLEDCVAICSVCDGDRAKLETTADERRALLSALQAGDVCACWDSDCDEEELLGRLARDANRAHVAALFAHRPEQYIRINPDWERWEHKVLRPPWSTLQLAIEIYEQKGWRVASCAPDHQGEHLVVVFVRRVQS
jgi:hypothetical protein